MINGLTILGVPIDDVSMEEALSRIDALISEKCFHQIATANVDFLVNAIDNREYREILCRCDLVVADGMPVVLASRLLGTPLRERVTGSDMIPLLARKHYRLFLLGAKPEVSIAAAKKLEEMGAQIAGRMSPPPSPVDQFDDDTIVAAIEKARPDILLVAMGSPKQEIWIHRNRERLSVPVCMGIGGGLDFLVGAVPRAPQWMRRAGLEWAYRVWAEPRRLARRYAKGAVWMARYFPFQLANNLAARSSGRPLETTVDSIGSVGILSPSGRMTGPRLAEFEQSAVSVADRGDALVVDLTGVSYLGADGLRTLTGLFRFARNQGRQLWLVGVTSRLVRTLKASRCEGIFRSAPSVFDAVRQASRGRLQLSLEFGEGWAVCRIGGEIPQGTRGTIEGICRQVLETNEFFEFDGSGVPDFDTSRLAAPARSACRLVLGDGRHGEMAQRRIAKIAV